MTRPGSLICCFVSIVAFAGAADSADAQSDPSPWRFGVTLGGGALLGVVAEYWSDDLGVEARLGTVAFRDMSVRLSPKWRVGAWDGGEASWRAGVQWLISPVGNGFLGFHGVELAKVTEGGHVIGGSYNLPLFVGGSFSFSEDPEDPEDPEELDDPESPEPGFLLMGAVISVGFAVVMGEFTYRYQAQPGS